MASNRGYATAQQVKDKLAGLVNGSFSDSIIEAEINRWEGVTDAILKVSASGNTTGSKSLTYASTKALHCIVNGFVVCGAALGLCGPNILSWNTLAQLQNAQNILTYQINMFAEQLEDETVSNMIVDE